MLIFNYNIINFNCNRWLESEDKLAIFYDTIEDTSDVSSTTGPSIVDIEEDNNSGATAADIKDDEVTTVPGVCLSLNWTPVNWIFRNRLAS